LTQPASNNTKAAVTHRKCATIGLENEIVDVLSATITN